MKTSLFEKLRQPTTIVLSAGHNTGDPGKVNGKFKEAEEAIMLELRKANGLSGLPEVWNSAGKPIPV